MKRFTLALVTAALGLTLGGGNVQADVVNFGYHYDISPGAVFPAGTGSVSFALGGDGTVNVTTGVATYLHAAFVSTTSSATNPLDSFNDRPFTFGMKITDTASGQTGTVTFNGVLSGQLGAGSSSLTASFPDGAAGSVGLGGRQYSVALGPSPLPLPAPGSSPGQLDVTVTVTSQPQEPRPTTTPEPSTLILGGSAASLLLVAHIRRRPKVAG